MGNQLSSTLPIDWATIDMLSQYSYCPRRFHLMYVEGRWEENEHTIEGKSVHRRIDRIDQLLPESKTSDRGKDLEDATGVDSTRLDEGDPPPEIARSVSLGSEELGLMGKLDLVSTDPEGGEAAPVETKKSRVPNTPERSYLPERVQLMAQGLLLREHGYHCDHGYVYYAGSRKRVRVDFSPELEVETRLIIANVREGRQRDQIPSPLDDSPKCWGCSLCGICLPDETRSLSKSFAAETAEERLLKEMDSSGRTRGAGLDVRRLFPARDIRKPLYVQEQGARIGKKGERLTISKKGEELGGVRLRDISQVILMGNVQVSAQGLHLLMAKGIPVIHLSTGGWFHGISHGINIENGYARASQYAAAANVEASLAFSKGLIEAKIANQRALILRNGSGERREEITATLAARLKSWKRKSPDSLGEILGWEGQAAALYFSGFTSMLKTGEMPEFQFTSRNRRPPRDPVNALLSYGYALLAKECVVALWGEGLDPWWGLFHQPRHGRPALALDLMEPFRPIISDSVVITSINTGMVGGNDFITNTNGCGLLPSGKKAFFRAWEQRLNQLYTHPEFDYRCSWRTIIRIQARLLARWLRQDIPRIPWPVVR